MLSARGLSVRANDLDLFAEPETAKRLAQALGADAASVLDDVDAPGGLRGRPDAPPPNYASAYFARLQVEGVGVDVVGGLARRYPGGIYRVPLTKAGVDARVVGDGWQAPLHRAEEWLVLYWLHPKGDGREQRLETYLRQGHLDRRYLEDILSRRTLPERVMEQGRRLLAEAAG